MQYKPYQHIERLGSDETDGILNGKFYIFPKIDGTNGCCYLDDNGELKCGSRNRELTLEKDNAGFYRAMLLNENIIRYLKCNPSHILYGEWLIKNHIKTYKDDAWRKFYVFDIYDTQSNSYLPYDRYAEILKSYNIDFIPLLFIGDISYTKNDLDILLNKYLTANTYLLKDNSGVGEGIVIKNYNYHNKYGRQTWAKVVTDEFKNRQKTKQQNNDISFEQIITNKYLTTTVLEKEFLKLKEMTGSWNSKLTPNYLNIIYNTFIHEELWDILKDYKNPTINFKLLQKSIYAKARDFLIKGVIN